MAKISHAYDTSFVMQYTIDLFYYGYVVDIRNICDKFDYEISSVRKLIYRISYNQTLIDCNYEIKLIKSFCYQRIKV